MGYSVNHKKVQRLMKKMGLKGKRPKEKYHSYKGEVGKVADNIINRNFKASKPDEKWTTDVSQFNLPFGKCYLSPILDMYTNEIISFDLSLHPNYEQIANMLDKAFEDHPDIKGLIFHSDQGWQYQMKEYREALKDKGIIQSMSRKGNCIDNCIMETFFGRMKNEMFYGYENQYRTFEQFYQAVRRCWRFGQTTLVNVYIIISAKEGTVKDNIERKQADFIKMKNAMSEFTKNITQRELKKTCRISTPYTAIVEMILPRWEEFSA